MLFPAVQVYAVAALSPRSSLYTVCTTILRPFRFFFMTKPHSRLLQTGSVARAALLTFACLVSRTPLRAQMVLGAPVQSAASPQPVRSLRDEWNSVSTPIRGPIENSRLTWCRVVFPDSVRILNSAQTDSGWAKPAAVHCSDGPPDVVLTMAGRYLFVSPADIQWMGSRGALGMMGSVAERPGTVFHLRMLDSSGRLDSLTMLGDVWHQMAWKVQPITPMLDSIRRGEQAVLARRQAVLAEEHARDSMRNATLEREMALAEASRLRQIEDDSARARDSRRATARATEANRSQWEAETAARADYARQVYALLRREGATDQQARAAMNGTLYLGMTMPAVQAVWGAPTRRAQRVGASETWWYRDTHVVEFQNGRAISIIQ